MSRASRESRVEEEADECGYWLELLAEADIVSPAKLAELMKETDEITAIIVSAIRTAKQRRHATPSGP